MRTAPRQALFRNTSDRHSIRNAFIIYHLMRARSSDMPDVNVAGHTRRRRAIRLGRFLVDKRLLRFDEGGLIGHLAAAIGADDSQPVAHGTPPSERIRAPLYRPFGPGDYLE